MTHVFLEPTGDYVDAPNGVRLWCYREVDAAGVARAVTACYAAVSPGASTPTEGRA